MGDCSVGLQQVFHKHNLDFDDGSHILCNAYGASHVYGDVHMKGDVRGDVTQVPHAQLMTDVFGAEGDVNGLLQFFAQMEVDRIRSIRQVAAALQNSSCDDKTIGWGASGKSAWGQNRLCERPGVVETERSLTKSTSLTRKPSSNRSVRRISDRRPYWPWRKSLRHYTTTCSRPP